MKIICHRPPLFFSCQNLKLIPVKISHCMIELLSRRIVQPLDESQKLLSSSSKMVIRPRSPTLYPRLSSIRRSMPPPNQIVHVKTDEAYTTDGGLYTPVWVSGLMKTEQSKSSLNFVDGASDIPSSYALEATSVKPYE